MPATPISMYRRAAAVAVHLLTAGGAVCGLLAIDSIGRGELTRAFAWMAAAMAIDGVDGTLARRVDVARVLPGIDGTLLDNLVDYLNYVLAPAYLIAESTLMPAGWGIPAAAAICVASAFQFSHVEAKSADGGFRGFPSYWNVVAFYLVLLDWDPRVALAVVGALSLLVFAPLRFPYPSRTTEARASSLAFPLAWGACLLVLLVQQPEPSGWLLYGSLSYPAYYVLMGLRLSVGRAAQRRV